MSNKKKKKNQKRGINTLAEIMIVTSVAFCVLVAGVFLVSIRKVHMRSNTNLVDYSSNSTVITETILATRGDIYDKEGVTIAEDSRTHTVICYLDSSRDGPYVEDKENTAKVLATVLGGDYDTILYYLSSDTYQTEIGSIGKYISTAQMEEIESYGLSGVEFTDSIQRVYPLGQFASNLIGYTGPTDTDDTIRGRMGIEEILDAYLQGTDGYREYQQGQNGLVLPGMKETVVSATNGNNVTLTIDSRIQEELERSFTITQETFDPDRIWGAVMEVDTGKVVAWGQYPSFDPNILNITEYSNYGADTPYEPGSTLKTFTWAAAINEGVYNSEDTAEGYKYCYVDNSNGDPVRTYDEDSAYGCVMNYHDESYSNPTLDEGLKYSLNTVAAAIQNEYITPEIHLQYLKDFGFFQDVDTDGIAEQSGILNFTWAADKINLSFGQGSTVTMLQLLQAYSAIMGDGTMKKPYFIDSIRDSYDNSKILYQGETEIVSTPITAETAEKVRSILYKVVNEEGGTAYRYQIPECKVIGKTGTTEVAIDGTYDTDHVISSIILGLPADNPKIIVYYAFEMDFQNIGTNTQAVTNILRKVAQIYGLSDNMEETETTQETEETDDSAEVTYEEVETYIMPSLVNHSVDFATSQLSDYNVEVVTLGSGAGIIDQYPVEGVEVESNQKVFLLTDTQSFTMPDLTGWTRKDVAGLWAVTGFSFKLSGQGTVVSQSIPAGSVVTKGTTIEVDFE